MIERYTRKEMAGVWSLENKFQKMLEVEKAVALVQGEKKIIPKKAASEIQKVSQVSVKRILQIEKTTHHDVVAFVKSISEKLGSSGAYVHYGLTSSDVLDTALSLQCQQAGVLLKKSLKNLEKKLLTQIQRHKATVCAGRTHGCHAEPTTFGYKLSGYFTELQRHKQRLERALEGMKIGKLSGAVGAYAFITPSLEKSICKKLQLEPETIATQVIPRDRHCEMLGAIFFLGSFLERLSLELRHLQRTELGEVLEKFSRGQTGSSAMPHKKNPISAENLSGIARLLRSYFLAAQDNTALWHERDISHSSVERVVFPDSFILCDYALYRMSDLIEHIDVRKERMKKNMEISQGQIFSSSVLLALVKKGLSRTEAYEIVQSASHKLKKDEHLRDKLFENPKIKKIFNKKEWEKIFKGEERVKEISKLIEKRILCHK